MEKEIVKHDITRAMMDASDGLLIDLGRMMAESKKGAVIHLEKLPIPPLLRKKNKEVLALRREGIISFSFTFPKSRLKKIQGMIQQGYPISIGEVKQGKDVTVLSQGKVYDPQAGYEHFRKLPVKKRIARQRHYKRVYGYQ